MSYTLTHTQHESKYMTCPNPACGVRLGLEWEAATEGPQLGECPSCKQEITFNTELTLTVTVERNVHSSDTSFPRP